MKAYAELVHSFNFLLFSFLDIYEIYLFGPNMKWSEIRKSERWDAQLCPWSSTFEEFLSRAEKSKLVVTGYTHSILAARFPCSILGYLQKAVER